MTTIAIVQCGAAKRPTTQRAGQLYTGSLFLALQRAAIRIADRYYIASAKHGLISPMKVIRPYDATLPAKGDLAWAAAVKVRLHELEPDGWTHLVALCSTRYLVGWADELGAITPIKGLSIGRAIRAANQLRKGSIR